MNSYPITTKERGHRVRLIFSLLFFLFLLCTLFATESYGGKAPVVIGYGTQLGDIHVTHDIFLLFLPGVAKETHVGNIELEGKHSSLYLQSAYVSGNILIGDRALTAGIAEFKGKNAYIDGSLSLYGDVTLLTLGENLTLNDVVLALGTHMNTVVITKTFTAYDITIGSYDSQSKNSLTLNDAHIISGNIYITGSENNIHILGDTVFFPSTILEIWGASHIHIASPISSFDFISICTPDDIHSLTLDSGFSHTGGILTSPLPNKIGNTFTIAGGVLLSDIIIHDNVDINLTWSAGSVFVGTIYGDDLMTTVRGKGFYGSTVESHSIDYSILGLQGNTTWNGNLTGNSISLGLIDSSVLGDITLQASSGYITNSVITGSLYAYDSHLIFNTVDIYGQNLHANTSIIEGTISFISPTKQPNTYMFSSEFTTIDSATSSFSTQNEIVGDTLHLHIPHLQEYNKDIPLFVGDVNFNTLTADTLILGASTAQEYYTIDYVMIDTQNYTEIRRVENVLQGFTFEPQLYRNTMSGYDVALVPNATQSGNYDLVLLGFSSTNDAYSGAIFSHSLHTNILQDRTQSQVMQALHASTNSTSRAIRGLSIWSQGSFHYIEKNEEGFSPLKTYLISGSLGITSAPITITDKVTTILDTFLHVSSSKTKVYDVKDRYSDSATSTLIGYILSTWSFKIIEKHYFFFSTGLGGGSYKTNVHRPYALTTDTWTNYIISTHFYTGYIGKLGAFSYIPYIGAQYTLSSEFSFTSQDNTHVQREASHTLSPLVGLILDYSLYGFRPYLHTSFGTSQDISKAKLLIQHREREYTTHTMYTNVALGFEYMHLFRYGQFSFLGEVGMRATIHKKTDIVPYMSLQMLLSF